MLIRLLSFLILNFIAVNSFASNLCDTLPDYPQLTNQLHTRIQTLQPGLQLGNIARNIDGSILYMNQPTAVNYCTSLGQHLPSSRELAQLAKSMSAAGISETVKDGYYKVSAKNADGKADIFYFSSTGYNRPAGDLGKTGFWSSSVYLYGPGLYFILSGLDGNIRFDGGGYNLAVLCMCGQ